MRLLTTLSLVANVGLLAGVSFLLRPEKTDNSPASVEAPAVARIASSSTPGPSDGRRWNFTDAPTVLDELRHAGAPPTVLYAVAMALVQRETADEHNRIRFPPGRAAVEGAVWCAMTAGLSPEARAMFDQTETGKMLLRYISGGTVRVRSNPRPTSPAAGSPTG